MPTDFRILFKGYWTPGQVEMVEVPSTLTIAASTQKLIDDAWTEIGKRTGLHLFDGPMCRLESVDQSARPNHLRFTFSRTSYKPFFGTNLTNAHIADTLGEAALANSLGASVALLAGDGLLLLGRRSSRVAYYPNRIHPFAGTLEPKDTIDPFNVVYRELAEELSLSRNEITDVALIGMVSDTTIRQPELVYIARTSLTSHDIAARLDKQEHDAMWAGTIAEARDMAHEDILTPIARATIALLIEATNFSS